MKKILALLFLLPVFIAACQAYFINDPPEPMSISLPEPAAELKQATIQTVEPKAEVLPIPITNLGMDEEIVCWQSQLTRADLMKTGAILYDMYCASCHGRHGQGAVNAYFPALATNGLVTYEDPVLPVAYFLTHPSEFHQTFPSFYERDIASVMTYIRNSFGNNASVVCPEDVDLSLAP